MWTILCWEWFITITGEIVTELIFFVSFQKYYLYCLKCTPSYLKHSYHTLTAKRIKLFCWAWHFPKLWEFIIKIKTYCSGRGELQEHQESWRRWFICSPIWQDVNSVCFSMPWNAEVTNVCSDQFLPPWPLLTSPANLPCWAGLQALLEFLMSVLPPSSPCLWDIFAMPEWVQEGVGTMELGCQHSSA